MNPSEFSPVPKADPVAIAAYVACNTPSPIQPEVGGMRETLVELLGVIDAEPAPFAYGRKAWLARLNKAQHDARALLASTSPAQTGEPDAWQDPDCPRHVISKEDKRDFTDPAINGAVSRMNAERCTRPLFATRQTGGVDQAWADKAMELADQYFLRRHWHEGHIDAARAELRTHLSTALGAKGKS